MTGEDGGAVELDTLVKSLLGRGVMIAPEALDYAKANPDTLIARAFSPSELESMVITLDVLKRPHDPEPESPQESQSLKKKDDGHRVLQEYRERPDGGCGDISEFLDYFCSRYEKQAPMLRNRPELMHDLVSIGRLSGAGEREDVSMIGLVSKKRETYSGHVMLEVEDRTGSTNVLVSKSSHNFRKAEDVVEDELIGITGKTGRGNIVFADDIIFPEVPNVQWPGGTGAAVFISDTHAGSKGFLEEKFSEFVSWMSTEAARKVKYLFVAGDVIDGIGVYKGQHRDLAITDAEKQYEKFAELISGVPKEVVIFIGPGNHDVTREAEPQPKIPWEFAKSVYALPNVVMTSSPAWISVEGITVLMYHGTGLDSVIDSLPKLRKTGYMNPHTAMICMLQKRHLMPSYGEKTRIYPDKDDFMVIDRLPNVFHSGHVHSVGIANYRGIRVINSGTFQARTAFQSKIGHQPSPAKVVYMDLQSGKAGILDFSGQDGGHDAT